MASPSEDSKISTEGRVLGIQEAPDTPDVNINYTVKPKTFEEWSQIGLANQDAATLKVEKAALTTMVQGLEQHLMSTLKISLGSCSQNDGLVQAFTATTTIAP